MNSPCSEHPPLPIRPRPFEDELLSSWLIRLAHALGYKAETLCRILFGRGHALWCRDVDALPEQEIHEVLSCVTGVPRERVRATTLTAWIEDLSPPSGQRGSIAWLLPLGIYHRTRRLPGLMFCPQCLRQGQPYFRRTWRLAFVTACRTHGVDLLERCGHCEAVLAPHRTDLHPDGLPPREGVLTSCWNCGHALANSPTATAAKELVMLTDHLQGVLQRGYVARASNPNLHAHLYFQGLRRITAALHLADSQSRQFEFSPLMQRRQTLARLADCVFNAPDDLAQRLKTHGLRHTDLQPTRSDVLPYWLACEVRPLMRHQAADRGAGEALAAARALQSVLPRFEHSRSRSRFGFDLPRAHLPADLAGGVTHDAYECLIMSLEQRFAMASNPMERFRLLQDKVLFILLRCGYWTTEGLSRLTFEAVEASHTQSWPLDTWSIPTSWQAARAWLWWHHTAWRPQLAKGERCPREFVSPHTGHGLSPSAIGERFRRAVDGAMLVARIPSIASFKIQPEKREAWSGNSTPLLGSAIADKLMPQAGDSASECRGPLHRDGALPLAGGPQPTRSRRPRT
jgi:hypothetical protein